MYIDWNTNIIKINTKLYIFQVDVDECEDIAMEYNISSMPTFVFIKECKQICSFAGANAERLADYLEKNAQI